ncbi:MAG: peptidyl-prolyl cis-trans isomerase [Myxococcaceae bacterium]|nr:peptidyl-prolyl cis-trans isomerase [Myxococcaceae bacterium]
MNTPRRHPSLVPTALTVACAAAALAGCHEKQASAIDGNTVAIVNGELITREEFEKEFQRNLQFVDALDPRAPEQVEPMRRALLDELIDQRLLLQAAAKLNITARPEEVDRRVMRISADYPAEGFNEALVQSQLTQAELKRKTAALLVVEKLFDEHVYPRVAVTEEEIRQYFEEHKDEFSLPERVHAQQIVVKTLDEARRVQQLLRQGKKFADLARKYSLSADAKVGGDLGFFARGQMPPAFDDVAFRLGVGQVSDVVATEYGFHLFKVLEKKPARQLELTEARREVEAKILELKRAEAQRAYVARLRQEATVTINEPVLQSITGRPQANTPSPKESHR